MYDETEKAVNRRRFLQAAAVVVAGSAAVKAGERGVRQSADRIDAHEAWLMKEVMKFRNIDAHGHVGQREIRSLIEAADRLGIEKLACSQPATGGDPARIRAANDRVLAAMKQYPDRILGQCYINPRYPREALAEIDRCIGAGMVQLGELYTDARINDPVYYPVIEKCIELRIPIMMHARADLGLVRPQRNRNSAAPPTTSIAEHFVEAARRYPEALLVHGHIGGGGDWEYMCKVLKDAPSVYIDTSGSVSDEGMIDMAVKYLGVERLLFATDMNFETGVGKIMAANLTDEQRRQIFRDNYIRLLNQRGSHAR